MNYKTITALTLICLALPAKGESVAFIENFDSDYSASFPTVIDAYGGLPSYAIQTLFIGLNGSFEAWWHLKDSSSATDRYIASHSYYYTPAKSSSWLCSRAIEIPTEGYVLTFGAQSYEWGGHKPYGEGLSDLWVYVTETLPTKNSLPSAEEATMHISNVPVGKSDADVASDFTDYSINLDEWAGKTIYVCFANLNEDKDILALDNIKVARADRAELEIATPASMSADAEYVVAATVHAVQPLSDWTLSFTDGNTEKSFKGESMAAGESQTCEFVAPISVGQTMEYQVTLRAEMQDDIIATGTVSRLSFQPYRRVLIEEITGQWCGNCPLGAYTVESMLEDEDMKDYVVPVAVHINSGGNDQMVCEDYSKALGVTAAPMFRLNREARYVGVGVHDYVFNPKDELSLAWQVSLKHLEPTFFNIELEGALNSEGSAFDMVATVTSALPLKNNRYSVGWVLTENNVGGENTRLWYQTNYFSGVSLDGDLGGWTKLPEKATGIKWHDVARGVWDIIGAEGALPKELEYDQPYQVVKSLSIPNPAAGPVNPDNCMVIAYVVDTENMEIMNVAWLPMSETAQDRITIKGMLGIGDVEIDANDCEPEYYNLQGVRIERPKGYCIEKRGTKSKVLRIR